MLKMKFAFKYEVFSTKLLYGRCSCTFKRLGNTALDEQIISILALKIFLRSCNPRKASDCMLCIIRTVYANETWII